MVKTFKQHSFKEKYEGEPGVGTTEYEDSIEELKQKGLIK